MNSKNTFTKKDLVAVLVCIIFLLANLAAVGEVGRRRAKQAACLSNLMKWGQIFQAYTADNDGYFHERQVATPAGFMRMWYRTYEPLYMDRKMLCCPAADNPELTTGPFGVWNSEVGAWDPCDYYGSYGLSRYIVNMKNGMSSNPAFWRRVDVKGADNVPVLMDCQYVTFFASSNAAPPEYDGDYHTPEMNWITINRHEGHINVVFMDFSARKVGLKELRTLKFSRTFNTCDIYTICGNGGDEAACAARWDEKAPWMKDFPEY